MTSPDLRRLPTGRDQPGIDRTTVVLGVALCIGLTAAFVLPQWGVLTPDTKPELYLNPDRLLGRALSAWQPAPTLGSPNYNTGIAPAAALVLGMQQVGVAPWLSQRLLALLLTLVGAAGAGALTHHLTRRRGLVPLTAGIAYALHPYAVVSGATLPIRLPHAFLPWFVLAGVLALRRGGWRWPAVTVLAFAAMGGINGGVVNLLLSLSLPVAAAFLARTEDVPARVLLRRMAAIAGLCVLVSLHWLVPTLLATGSSATDVAAATEAPEAVAGTSSPIESLRGMGMWTLYLVLDGRPGIPAHAGYVVNWWIVAATLALPVFAAVGAAVARARPRLLAVGLVAVALPIMVGLHPPGRSSPFGRLLQWAFEHVPGAIGFRTTNKMGSMLALGIAVLVGSAVVARWRSRSLAPLVLATVLLAAGPLWAGRAQPVTLDVPDYWRTAASTLDTHEPGRLVFAPGNFQARYDWGYGGVDDLDTALFDHRDVVWRSTVPAGSRPAHSLLTAFDVGMNAQALSPAAAAAYLQLLGTSDVLVRADSENTSDGAATAVTLLETFTQIDGAHVADTWGPPRRQTPAFAPPAPPVPALSHVSLPPARPTRLLPLENSLVLTGDGFAVGNLVHAGYRVHDRDLAWIDELSAEELIGRLDAGARVVLTDTNQRRRWDIRGVDRSYSSPLRPGETLAPAETRARTTEPATQTTALLEGGTDISSSDETAGLFRATAANPPEFAADGDPNTSWLTGAFDTAEDAWIRLDYGEELPPSPARITVDADRDRRPTLLQVTAENDEFLVDVPRDGQVDFALLGPTSWIRVAVVRVAGEGPGPVGITDITVAGRSIRSGLALPPPLTDSVPTDVAAALAAAPLDVVLTRMHGSPTDPSDDEERILLRTFSLPGDRAMAVTATVRPTNPPEHLLDDVALRGADAVIRSDSPTVGGPLGRATQAFDGDPSTAWTPSGVAGELTIRTPSPILLSQLQVQRARGSAPATLQVTAGSLVHESLLLGSRTVVRLPRNVRTDEIRLTVSAPPLEGRVTPLQEIELADIRTSPITRGTLLRGCTRVGDLSGDEVRVRVDASVARLLDGRALTMEGCAPVSLGAGTHRYDAGFGWPVDQLVLRTDRATDSSAASPGEVEVLARTRTSRRLLVEVDRPALLSTGIAWDPRWQATTDGRLLDPPVMTAGHAVGWEVPAGSHEIEITYRPQRFLTAATITSGTAVLALFAVALLPPRRRR